MQEENHTNSPMTNNDVAKMILVTLCIIGLASAVLTPIVSIIVNYGK